MGTENGLGGGREMMHDDPSFRSSPFLPSEEEKRASKFLPNRPESLKKRGLQRTFPLPVFSFSFFRLFFASFGKNKGQKRRREEIGLSSFLSFLWHFVKCSSFFFSFGG